MIAIRRLSPFITGWLVAACGGDSTSTAPATPVPTATVTAASAIRFTPATVDLAVGGTVTFQFQGVQHNVFFDGDAEGAPANIPTPTANASVDRKFDTPGRYNYNCHIHPGMSGVIIVH
jgi:plastocyanin